MSEPSTTTEDEIKEIASQLRKPQGEHAATVGNSMNKGNLLINQSTLEVLPVAGNENILEIGMGNGHFVNSLFEKGKNISYSGCDYSPEMVNEALRKNQQLVSSGRVEFREGKASELPYFDEQFDVAFSVNTLYFWAETTKTFSEIKRVLKPSGRLILSIRPKNVMENYPFTRYGFAMYSREELYALFTGNGFEIEEIIHRIEPDQEINGKPMKVETLIAIGIKK